MKVKFTQLFEYDDHFYALDDKGRVWRMEWSGWELFMHENPDDPDGL